MNIGGGFLMFEIVDWFIVRIWCLWIELLVLSSKVDFVYQNHVTFIVCCKGLYSVQVFV